MDDLLYLMAHAPAEPPDWFEPAIEPPPPSAKHPINPTDQEREELRGLGDWLSPEEATCPRVKAYGAELDAARIAYAAWKSRYYRERYLQWPRAWAEEMLKRRDRGAS